MPAVSLTAYRTTVRFPQYLLLVDCCQYHSPCFSRRRLVLSDGGAHQLPNALCMGRGGRCTRGWHPRTAGVDVPSGTTWAYRARCIPKMLARMAELKLDLDL